MTNDIKFTGEIPVTINYNGSSDDIYAPVRASSCDINIVSSQLLTDLYTARKDEVCVKVEKEGEVIWEGYMTPNVYTQELTQNLDEIAMTAIDPVSLMKYVKLDKILTRPNVFSYKELIGKALGYVMIDNRTLNVEENFTYESDKSLLEMYCQVSNFWDEASEPSTLYEMMEEMLRPFCLCLCFDGKAYWIYDVSRTESSRTFRTYTVSGDGTMTEEGSVSISDCLWDFDKQEWTSANTSRPSLEIGSTYDKVTGVASTCKAEFDHMVFDDVDYNDRDLCDIGQCNVDKNIVKGYKKYTSGKSVSYQKYEKSAWYYLWNGVYTNSQYDLESVNGYVNGWLNCNKLYEYYTGSTGHPSDYGSILNFYGGTDNAVGTSKTQTTERSVSVSKSITAYAADNGVPPEFLDKSDLKWTFNAYYRYGDKGVETDPYLIKTSESDSRFGTGKNMQSSNRIVYHQEYPNMQLIAGDQQIVEIGIGQSYSRTGINQDIDMIESSIASNQVFHCNRIDDGQGEGPVYAPTLSTADVYCFPECWKSSSVKAGYPYFNRYNAGEGLCTEIWDKRRIDLYVQTSDGDIYQFNGKTWVDPAGTDNQVKADNAFYLKVLMNDKQLFCTSMKYNLIETSDGTVYSLGDEQITYYKDGSGVTTNENKKATSFPLWKSEAGEFVMKSEEGEIQVNLPDINSTNVSVFVNIYNSTMLGMTGGDNIAGKLNDCFFVYDITGTGIFGNDEEAETRAMTSSDLEGGVYGAITTQKCTCEFIPVNATYVKAEHLDLDISVTVPDSNLGQMFSESDIKYTLDRSSGYLETYEGPTFRVNTHHPLVKSSFSYLIADGEIAEPSSFLFNGVTAARPECYVVQAYMNWLSTIRKTYKKTLVPVEKDKDFNTVCCFITSPETGDNNLMIVGDSIDVKTGRHSITAIEDHGLPVGEVENIDMNEIPRTARSELYRLPTAYKQ